MKKARTNVGASVRARLLHIARERGDDYQLLLTRYVNERLLYRLGQSEHANAFVLKRAVLFTLRTGKPHRTTRDVDLLGFAGLQGVKFPQRWQLVRRGRHVAAQSAVRAVVVACERTDDRRRDGARGGWAVGE